MRNVILALAFLLVGIRSAAAQQAELHTFHCLFGCPLGAPATNDTIVREIYTLSSNDITRMADWVAYRIMPSSIGLSEARNWQEDAALSSDERLTEKHFDGAPAALRIDRGHQAPLAAFSGTEVAGETNILSNITPQASALNQGPWQRLEGRERELTRRINGPVYVYTGPLFERMMRPMPAGPAMHRVPSGYWKIISLADGRFSAFIMDQNTPRNASFCDFRVSLLDLQLRSRLVFFPRSEAPPVAELDAELGCTGPRPPAPAPSEITTR